MSHEQDTGSGIWHRHAVLSDCQRYRYTLTRSRTPIRHDTPPGALFVMLNPSTADANIDDPTIRRCMRFTERIGQSHLQVVNLFAWRATNPREVAGNAGRDRTGDPQNAQVVLRAAQRAATVIVAWGASAPHYRVRYVVERCLRIHGKGPRLYCLGTTKSGAPRHPLYVRGGQALEEWDPKPYLGVVL